MQKYISDYRDYDIILDVITKELKEMNQSYLLVDNDVLLLEIYHLGLMKICYKYDKVDQKNTFSVDNKAELNYKLKCILKDIKDETIKIKIKSYINIFLKDAPDRDPKSLNEIEYYGEDKYYKKILYYIMDELEKMEQCYTLFDMTVGTEQRYKVSHIGNLRLCYEFYPDQYGEFTLYTLHSIYGKQQFEKEIISLLENIRDEILPEVIENSKIDTPPLDLLTRNMNDEDIIELNETIEIISSYMNLFLN